MFLYLFSAVTVIIFIILSIYHLSYLFLFIHSYYVFIFTILLLYHIKFDKFFRTIKNLM